MFIAEEFSIHCLPVIIYGFISTDNGQKMRAGRHGQFICLNFIAQKRGQKAEIRRKRCHFLPAFCRCLSVIVTFRVSDLLSKFRPFFVLSAALCVFRQGDGRQTKGRPKGCLPPFGPLATNTLDGPSGWAILWYRFQANTCPAKSAPNT